MFTTISLYYNFFLYNCDSPVNSFDYNLFNFIGFQDPATPLMNGLIALHSDLWCIMLFIAGFVLTILGQILIEFQKPVVNDEQEDLDTFFLLNNQSYKVHHNSLIEIIWTIIPALIVIIIAIPSFALLYSLDEIVHPDLTIKAIGRQWAWSYEYGDYVQTNSLIDNGLYFDSNFVQDDDLETGQLRLLDVDNRVVLPVNKNIRLLTSASDVIHSFAVPSLGIKLDAIPGRLNQTIFLINRQGVFYGQCSELCGTGHAQMPICIESVSQEDYVNWVCSKLDS